MTVRRERSVFITWAAMGEFEVVSYSMKRNCCVLSAASVRSSQMVLLLA
jgi:hypothetical protein